MLAATDARWKVSSALTKNTVKVSKEGKVISLHFMCPIVVLPRDHVVTSDITREEKAHSKNIWMTVSDCSDRMRDYADEKYPELDLSISTDPYASRTHQDFLEAVNGAIICHYFREIMSDGPVNSDTLDAGLDYLRQNGMSVVT